MHPGKVRFKGTHHVLERCPSQMWPCSYWLLDRPPWDQQDGPQHYTQMLKNLGDEHFQVEHGVLKNPPIISNCLMGEIIVLANEELGSVARGMPISNCP